MGFYSGVQCDKCGSMLNFDKVVSERTVTDIAINQGWHIGKYCSCPDCGKKTIEHIGKYFTGEE